MPSIPQTSIRVRADIPGYYAGHRRAGEEFDFASAGPLPKWLKAVPADPLAAAIAALDPNDDAPAAGRRVTRTAAPKAAPKHAEAQPREGVKSAAGTGGAAG